MSFSIYIAFFNYPLRFSDHFLTSALSSKLNILPFSNILLSLFLHLGLDHILLQWIVKGSKSWRIGLLWFACIHISRSWCQLWTHLNGKVSISRSLFFYFYFSCFCESWKVWIWAVDVFFFIWECEFDQLSLFHLWILNCFASCSK